MITKKYSAGLMSESFWFIEFKEYSRLIRQGVAQDEIKKEIVENNRFGAPNKYRAERIYGYIKRRASTLDEKGIELFFSSNVSTQKIINLICILRSSRIFFEFVNEVYRDFIILGTEFIDRTDAIAFFRQKDIQCDEISNWKESTKKRLSAAFITLLTDSNLLTKSDKKRIITPPVLDIELERYLEKNGEKDIAKAITGVY